MLSGTATQTQPLTARQRKARRGVLKSATVSHVVYLLKTKFQATL
ncbi:hypothetical protein [Pilibacter termitis]|nr:hypothetical protein [Pilibacter termitis]